jgi:hypothetical protein
METEILEEMKLAMPAGQHEIKRAALSSDSNNPALQPRSRNKTRRWCQSSGKTARL